MIKWRRFDTDRKNDWAIFTRWISFTNPLCRGIISTSILESWTDQMSLFGIKAFDWGLSKTSKMFPSDWNNTDTCSLNEKQDQVGNFARTYLSHLKDWKVRCYIWHSCCVVEHTKGGLHRHKLNQICPVQQLSVVYPSVCLTDRLSNTLAFCIE